MTRSNKLHSALFDNETKQTAKPEAATAATTHAKRPPSRVGKKPISSFVDPAVSKQLRLLAIELDSSNDALIKEALNDLFVKHGKAGIA